MSKSDVETRIQNEIIRAFCDRSKDDADVINPRMLQRFTLIFHEDDDTCEDSIKTKKLQGKFFLGLNVKTDSEENLRPIPFCWPKGYDPSTAAIAEGGSIPDMFELKVPNSKDDKPDQHNKFIWNPNKWDPKQERIVDDNIELNENIAVDVTSSQNGIIKIMFQNPYGPNYVYGRGNYDGDKNKEGNKYNILGEIYHNALHLDGDCYVMIHFFDYDLTTGKNLSFVLAVCEKEEDRDIIENKLDELLNFIMLVKARYVKKIQHQRQVESMKTAVASIMSRNMSHNLGSHYLYYTKNQLLKLSDKKENETIAPDIRGVAKVLGYMQARMDYLATIVSEDKYPYGSVFFKGQIFDELTIDDFSRRHFPVEADSSRRTVNYLLQNLILSENFTREPVYGNQNKSKEQSPESNKQPQSTGNKTVHLQVKTRLGMFNKKNDNQANAEAIKLDFSKICVALPGGIMSTHAFFNVVENFIRNSAKYLKEDFKDEGLVFTIVINELAADKENHLPERYEFVIYDNKNNANKTLRDNDHPEAPRKKLVEWMNVQLSSLKFLADNNELDKHSKGLKEMLVSTLWMRAFSWLPAYAKYSWKKMADKLVEFDEMKGEEKLKAITQHAFGFVAVDKEERVYYYHEKDGLEYYADDRGNKLQSDANLGIRFDLPKYRMLENIEAEEMGRNENLIGLNNFRDIVCIYDKRKVDQIEREYYGERRERDKEREKVPKAKNFLAAIFGSKKSLDSASGPTPPSNETEELLRKKENEASEPVAQLYRAKFTRVYPGKAKNINDEKEAVEIFRYILAKRFPEFDKYRLGMDDSFEEGFQAESDSQPGFNIQDYGIYFKRHIDKSSTIDKMSRYCYCEAISGENFTNTMNSIFSKGIVKGRYVDAGTEYFALKIKESALTRVTLIDERFFKDMDATTNKDELLRLKNIRVLNLKNTDKAPEKLIDMFEGNHFTDNENGTHFLSIHLGMIDKILKNNSSWILKNNLAGKPMAARVSVFFNALRDTFKMPNGELFISIHSGRGNFSPELDEWLKSYPFISISAIESVFNNSKFLLSQLFYNTVYIGKGEFNEQQK